jgi:alpha-mannosidase
MLGVQPLGRALGQERLDARRHYPDQDEVDWTRVAFRAPELGGLGLMTLDVGQGAGPSGSGAWLKGRTLGNEFLEVRVGPTGTLQLYDRRTRQRYRDLLSFESSGDAGDTYTYCPPARDQVRRSGGPVAVRALANGPMVAALELRWQMQAGRRARGHGLGSIGIRLIVSLYAGSPAVRVTVELDNRASDHRLRVRAPTRLVQGAAVAGAQFGFEARESVKPDRRKYPREAPVATAPAHRYVARAVKSRGLAILAPGFFEYELDRRGDLLVTILRAVGQLSRGDLPTRPGHAGWPVATPLAQCQGLQRLQLALAPVTQTQVARGSALAELWEDLFLPVQGVWLRQSSPLSLEPIDLRLEGEGLVFSALKPAERAGELVLRCYNATGKPVSGAWHFGRPVSAAQRARADEYPLHEIRLGEGGRVVPFHAAPHEIVTVMVVLARPG